MKEYYDKLDSIVNWIESILPNITRKYDFYIVLKTEENKTYWLNGWSGRMFLRNNGIVHPKDYLSGNLYLTTYKNYTNGEWVDFFKIKAFEDYINE